MTSSGAVLFDLDGTLLDTADDFIVVIREQCKRHKRLPPDASAIRETVSDGARAMVSLAFEMSPDQPLFEARREEFLSIYAEVAGQATVPFDGIPTTLQFIAELGLPWGIVTNKPRRFAEPLMERIGLEPEHQVLVCPDDVRQTKPAAEPMLKAALALGVSPGHCIYVGDHSRDIEAGRNAGMRTIAAAYGYVTDREAALAWKANHTVDSAHEIPAILHTEYKR